MKYLAHCTKEWKQLWTFSEDEVRQSRNYLFKPTFLPRNERTNLTFILSMMIHHVDLFSFVLWKKLKTPKKPFEINWPSVILGNCETHGLWGNLWSKYELQVTLVKVHIFWESHKNLAFQSWFEVSRTGAEVNLPST